MKILRGSVQKNYTMKVQCFNCDATLEVTASDFKETENKEYVSYKCPECGYESKKHVMAIGPKMRALLK